MTGRMWLIGPLVVMALRFLHAQALVGRASRSGGALVFRPALGLRILFGFSMSALLVVGIRDLGHEELWVIVLGFGMAVFIGLALPPTIMLDNSGITSSVWWRRKSKLDWNSVVDLEKTPDGGFTVYSATGKTIDFGRYNADPDRFEAEVLKRTKLRHARRLESTREPPHIL